jgi:hypothetical protein
MLREEESLNVSEKKILRIIFVISGRKDRKLERTA